MFGIAWNQFFLNTALLPWFWLLVGLLVLYLIRPRPVNQTIPSLMFLLQDKGKAIRNSFLRYFYRDFVFLIQLLIIALLVAAACQPYVELKKTQLVGNSVIVLDASASMQTSDGRWDAAIKAAKDALTGQNTIILVKNRPVVIGKDLSNGEANTILSTLKPGDTETNLYAAIVAAREYATSADSVVTIISDFRNTDEQQDYKAAIKTVAAAGPAVQVRPVGTAAKNIGIISMDVSEQKTRIGIKNYEPNSVVATVTAENFKQDVPLVSGATDYVTFTTPSDVTTVTLTPKDDFPLDNTITIANNNRFNIRVLIVTNSPDIRKTPLYKALQSISDTSALKFQIDVNTPPTLVDVNHDIIIFDGVSKDLLVQRTVRDAAAAAKAGKAVIIVGQPDLFAMNWEGMLPLSNPGRGGPSGVDKGRFTATTSGIEFGDVQAYNRIDTNASDFAGGRFIAIATTDGSPLISTMPFGKGTILYYGIEDTLSSFPSEPTYPVFWKNTMNILLGRISIDALNVQTGASAVGVSGIPKKVPEGSVNDFTGFFDAQGPYVWSDRTVAANLLSADESDVSARPISPEELTGRAQSEVETKQKELAGAFALAALILLFLELFIVKFRGDF